MTKADLVDEISVKTKISKSETATIVDQLLNAISRALSEGKHIEIRGFGTFKVRERRRSHGPGQAGSGVQGVQRAQGASPRR